MSSQALHNMSTHNAFYVLITQHVNSGESIIVQAHEFDFIFPSGERFRPGDFSIETCDGVSFTLVEARH